MTTIASQITNLKIVYSTVYSDADQRKYPISKQMSLPPFIFLEAIRHIRHFLIDKVLKETLWPLSNYTYGTHKYARFGW